MNDAMKLCFFPLLAVLACSSSVLAQSPFPLPIPTRPTSFPLSVPTLSPLQGFTGAMNGWNSTVPGAAQGRIVLLKGSAAIDSDGRGYAIDANLAWLSLPQGLVDISGEGNAILALKADGDVVALGNVYTGVGNYGNVADLVPAEIAENTIVSVAHSGGNFMALSSTGRVISWEAPSLDYTVSPPTPKAPTPVPPDAEDGVVAIAIAGEHRLALKSDGRVVAWGRVVVSSAPDLDSPGMLPFLVYADAASILPPEVAENVVAIAAGPNNGLALKGDGSLVQWGKQYSYPGGVSELFPMPHALSRKQVVAISGSSSSSLVSAVTSQGDVYHWGLTGMNFAVNSSAEGRSAIQVANGAYGDTTYYLSLSDESSFADIVGLPLDRLAQLVAQKILAHTNNYGLATKPDLLSAVEQAALQGEAQGVAAVQSAPNDYNLYSSTQYEASRATGVAEGKAEVTANPSAFNLYSPDSIMDLRMNGAMVQKQGDAATVVFQPQITTDLATEPFVNHGTPITNTIPMPGDKGFLRIQAR